MLEIDEDLAQEYSGKSAKKPADYTYKVKYTMNISVAEGKYTVIQDATGRLRALRYGEEWRDLCGDSLVYALAAEIEELRAKVSELESDTDESTPKRIKLTYSKAVNDAREILIAEGLLACDEGRSGVATALAKCSRKIGMLVDSTLKELE